MVAYPVRELGLLLKPFDRVQSQRPNIIGSSLFDIVGVGHAHDFRRIFLNIELISAREMPLT
jgi:hypothetical protein